MVFEATGLRALASTGKFCSVLAPRSMSPGSLGVTLLPARSIPISVLALMVLLAISFPVPDTTVTPLPVLKAITLGEATPTRVLLATM